MSSFTDLTKWSYSEISPKTCIFTFFLECFFNALSRARSKLNDKESWLLFSDMINSELRSVYCIKHWSKNSNIATSLWTPWSYEWNGAWVHLYYFIFYSLESLFIWIWPLTDSSKIIIRSKGFNSKLEINWCIFCELIYSNTSLLIYVTPTSWEVPDSSIVTLSLKP